MITKKYLYEKLDNIYHPMIDQINIADFYKCIAQFAGIDIRNVSDSAIEEYLTKWCHNKYRFFEFFNYKTRMDMPIEYDSNIGLEAKNEFKSLAREYPGYAPWLLGFEDCTANKITDYRHVDYNMRDILDRLFPDFEIEGSTITHTFAHYLKAPDELVTAIGRIFENSQIHGTYTLSIDPVDMMLASENPYDWNSCYRLTIGNMESHADGCLAAILDKTSIISYIWTREGKYALEEDKKYILKSIRYKKIREWIAIAPDWKSVYFNLAYPGKQSYPSEFNKILRDYTETLVSKYLGVDNIWYKASNETKCKRGYYYGYNEFDYDNMYVLKCFADTHETRWTVYEEPIICPDGCGETLPGSDNDEYNYDGDGFRAESFDYDEYYCDEEDDHVWCDYIGDYCYDSDGYCDREHCVGCANWDENHTTQCPNNSEVICQDRSNNSIAQHPQTDVLACYLCSHSHDCPIHAETQGVESENRDSSASDPEPAIPHIYLDGTPVGSPSWLDGYLNRL